jgi:hypothetical protein
MTGDVSGGNPLDIHTQPQIRRHPFQSYALIHQLTSASSCTSFGL